MAVVPGLGSWYETTRAQMLDARKEVGAKLRWPGLTLPPLRLGSDCAGLEAAGTALKAMKVRHDLVFASDASAASRAWLRTNHRPGTLWSDMFKRPRSEVSKAKVQVYTAGFSCKPWSRLNGDGRFWDHPEAGLFEESLRTISVCQPPCAFLENVVGFGRVWTQALRIMQKHVCNYKVRVVRFCSSDLGKPIRRPRLWILLVREDVDLCKSEAAFAQVATRMITAAVTHKAGPRTLSDYLREGLLALIK